MARTSTLQAWLEISEDQTHSKRRVELPKRELTIGRGGGDLRLADPELSDIHAILTKEADGYVIRDLGSTAGTFLNNRPVVEARLTNLDEIRIGTTRLVFRAAYVPVRIAPADELEHNKHATEAPLAPGRHETSAVRGRVLIPFQMLHHPLRFWPEALETSVFDFRRTWMIHLAALSMVGLEAYLNGGRLVLLHVGLLLFASTVALALMAMTCSVFFAFDIGDTPRRLSQALRFTFCISPFLLAAQCGFLLLAGKTHPKPGTYFLLGLLPSAFIWAFAGLQSHHAFAATLTRGVAFAVTASVPWNVFMTGLMSFVI